MNISRTTNKGSSPFLLPIWTMLLALTGSLLAFNAAADNQAPFITPGFSDNQTFESLQDLYVSLNDNEDPNPDLSEILLSDSAGGPSQSLSALFSLACPSGFMEVEGQCLQQVSAPPVLTCPDGYTKSGTECTKRVVVQQSPDKSCPLGYISDTGSDPKDILKECVKYESVPATTACAPESPVELTLVDGRCYMTEDPVYGPANVSFYGGYKPIHVHNGVSYADYDDFLSPVDNRYYLPPTLNDRTGYDAPHRWSLNGSQPQYLLPRSACPDKYTLLAEDPSNYYYTVKELNEAGFPPSGECYIKANLVKALDGSDIHYQSPIGTPCKGIIEGNWYSGELLSNLVYDHQAASLPD